MGQEGSQALSRGKGLGGTWGPLAILKRERSEHRDLAEFNLQGHLATSRISFYIIQLKVDANI